MGLPTQKTEGQQHLGYRKLGEVSKTQNDLPAGGSGNPPGTWLLMEKLQTLAHHRRKLSPPYRSPAISPQSLEGTQQKIRMDPGTLKTVTLRKRSQLHTTALFCNSVQMKYAE